MGNDPGGVMVPTTHSQPEPTAPSVASAGVGALRGRLYWWRVRQGRMAGWLFAATGRLERLVEGHGIAVVVVVAAVLVVEQWLSFGRPGMTWDWPSLGAGLVFALALPFALRLREQSDRAVERLSTRGVLLGSSAELREWSAGSAEKWSRLLAPVTAAALLGTFVVVWGLTTRPLITAFATVAGFLAGSVVGRALATSRIGRRIERGDWTIRLQPGHVDGASGLKPIGDLYFRHATILAIPALWLAVRLTVTTFAFDEWRATYLGLLVAVIAIEIAAFVAPMMSFHRIMLSEKRRLLLEADAWGEKLHQLEERLVDLTDDEARASVNEQLVRLRDRCLQLEELPTWPVAPVVRRRFTTRNVLLLVPVLVNAAGMTLPSTELWETLIETFTTG